MREVRDATTRVMGGVRRKPAAADRQGRTNSDFVGAVIEPEEKLVSEQAFRIIAAPSRKRTRTIFTGSSDARFVTSTFMLCYESKFDTKHTSR